MFKNTFKPADFVVIGIVLLTALLLFTAFSIPDGGDSEKICVVSVTDGGSTHLSKLSLSYDCERVFSNAGHTLTVVISGGEVWVKDSDCPDKTCERTGKISKTGAVIACVPAKIMITIENGESVDADFIAG